MVISRLQQVQQPAPGGCGHQLPGCGHHRHGNPRLLPRHQARVQATSRPRGGGAHSARNQLRAESSQGG